MIELLVVIAIIGILVGIVVGAVQSVVRDRKIAQAKSEVQAIAMAAEEYYRTFKEIPVWTNWYVPTAPESADVRFVPGASTNMGREFYDRLTGSNGLQMVFLSIQRIEGVNSSIGILLDPWRSPYEFYLDSNYNGTVAGLFGKDCTIFVRSRGPNGLDNGNNPRTSDDITWPPLDTL